MFVPNLHARIPGCLLRAAIGVEMGWAKMVPCPQAPGDPPAWRLEPVFEMREEPGRDKHGEGDAAPSLLPEGAVLGAGRIKKQPVVVNDAVVVRSALWLSLTFDHRLVDGGPAARFLQRVAQLVEKPHLLLT